MNPGLYALASLTGAPLRERDLAVLGLASDGTEGAIRHVPGLLVRAADMESSTGSISFLNVADGLVCFLGYLDEPEALASGLGVETSSAAGIALAAVERFGREAPVRMLGEWSFLRWHILRRELTIVSSEARRDPIFFATNGDCVALSAEMLRLGRLSWVGMEIDPAGLAMQVSRAGLRHMARQATVCKRISLALPGSTEIFREGGRTTHLASPRPSPEIWRGSFDEAVNTLNETGRRIVGQHMKRSRRTAFLLSGGLDSTLLTSWGAQEQRRDREMFCVSSVAPEGSGLADERDFSSAVAEAFGLRIEFVVPPASWSPYRPSEAAFCASQSPMFNPRHYLVQALLEAAHVHGAHAVIDGAYGELSVTDKTPLPVEAAWKRLLLAARGRARDWQARRGWPSQAFHPQLSRSLLTQLPREWGDVWRAGAPRAKQLRPHEASGISPALAKNAPVSTSSAYGLRHLVPYRDRRLIELVARMPKSFTHQHGLTRSLARAMLAGRVPESIRLRRQGRPFSPDYPVRMRSEARTARARVEVYREAGLAEWLDLRWLSSRLEDLADGANASTAELFRVQSTANAAEFLIWMKV